MSSLSALLIAIFVVTPRIVSAVPQLVEASRGARIVGPEEGAGRLEVLVNGKWGTVCDDGFDLADANVVCRQLGFDAAMEANPGAWYGRGSGPIWMSNVACRGNEMRLSMCSHTSRHRCSHAEDVGVTCRRRSSDPEALKWNERIDFGVRLRGDTKTRAGYVEVLVHGRWGRVCPDGWGSKEARVVCGQLGYRKGRARVYVGDKSWNKSSKKYMSIASENVTHTALMTDVGCDGSEPNLIMCPHAGFSVHLCRSPGAAGVICSAPSKSLQSLHHQTRGDKQVRLRGSSTPWEGRVEVLWDGEWHKVCDHDWDLRDASVVCRQLGYGSAYEAVTRARGSFGQGFTRILLDNVQCTGHESKLLDCNHSSYYTHTCRHWENAGVRCNPPPVDRTPVRLSGGSESEGRVEIFKMSGTETGWIAVCGDGWDANDGAVACRQLRLGFVVTTGAGGRYGSGGDIELLAMNMQCKGHEDSLEKCWKGATGSALNGECKSGAAHVVCRKYLPDLIPNFQLTQGSLMGTEAIQRLRLSELSCAWEENCLSKSAGSYMGKGHHMAEARQFHYRYLLRFTVQVINFGTRDFLPIIDQKDWEWHDCHNHYHSFENFATYDLFEARSGERVAEGHKASFCLEDGACVDGGTKEYLCAANNQGISVNCADTYNHDIDCQWIDITDVPFGNYTLAISVNPNHLSAEMDYSNNVIKCSLGYHHRDGSLDNVRCQVGQ